MPNQQQKILILPPMKGLNLYDNPFTMSPEFAVELINFMPPTTVMQVRPGIEKIAELYGAIRGLYSYATGATVEYGQHWYEQTISYGESQLLLLKLAQNGGDSRIHSYNPENRESNVVADIRDNNYTRDYVNFKHAMFICTGNQNSPMYVWGRSFGWHEMVWKNSDGRHMSDLENITYYNQYLFASARNTFDIYCMKEENADPATKDNWNGFWSLFFPGGDKKTGQISLDGIAIKGGSVMKMFTLSRSGSNDVNSYLCICTNMGEIILYQGSMDDDKKDTDPMRVMGRFEIPIPLNKNCFCFMEGDVIVATKNGLFSLMRVIFGQTSEVTQSLESRIKNLFSDYMFNMSEFREFIGLFYNFKNRLLILNVPTQMPIPLNKIARGYTFTNEQHIIFPKSLQDNPSELINQVCNFIRSYLYSNLLDYEIFFQFNYSVGAEEEGIVLSLETKLENFDFSSFKSNTIAEFYILAEDKDGNIKRTDFLKEMPGADIGFLSFHCENFLDPASPVTLDPETPFAWNPALLRTHGTLESYNFKFPEVNDPTSTTKFKEWSVTDVIPAVSIFVDPRSELGLNEKFYHEPILRDDKLIFTNKINHPYFKDSKWDRPWVNIWTDYKQAVIAHMFDVSQPMIQLYFPKDAYNPVVKLFNSFYSHPSEWWELGKNVVVATQVNYTYIVGQQKPKETEYSDLQTYEFIVYYRLYNKSISETNVDFGLDYTIVLQTIDNSTPLAPINKTYNVFGITYDANFYKESSNNIHLHLLGVSDFAGHNAQNVDEKDLMLDGLNTTYRISKAGYSIPQSMQNNNLTKLLLSSEVEWTKTNFVDINDINKLNNDYYGWYMSPFYFSSGKFPVPKPTPEPIPPIPPTPGPTPGLELLLSEAYEYVPLSNYVKLAFTNEIKAYNFKGWGKNWETTWADYANYFKDERTWDEDDIKELYYPWLPKKVYDPIFRLLKSFVRNKKNWHGIGKAEQELDSESTYRYRLYKDGILAHTYEFTTSYKTRGHSPWSHTWLTMDLETVLKSIDEVKGQTNTYNIFKIHIAVTFGSMVTKFHVTTSNGVQSAKITDAGIPFQIGERWEIREAIVSCDQGVIMNQLREGSDEQKVEYGNLTIKNGSDAANLTNNYYGWYLSCFSFTSPPPPKSSSSSSSAPLGASQSINSLQNANFDLAFIPLLSGINILAPFRSHQYVMDANYGTWAQWQDVNMVDGIDHLNEFYFIIPKDYKPNGDSPDGFVYNNSMLCRFNPNMNGDFQGISGLGDAITVSYKTASSNLGNNQIKELSRIKVYGTASTFWGKHANELAVTMSSDFYENPTEYYQHETVQSTIHNILGLDKNFDLRELTYSQLKEYYRLYAEASSAIRSIDMGLTGRPANRIGLEVSMQITEHNIIVYGYELYFKLLNKL